MSYHGSYSNRPFRGQSGRSGQGFRGQGRSQRANHVRKSVDPRLLIQKATPAPEQVEYIPQHSFSDFQIADSLKKSIELRGYTSPTPIQDQAIPYLLQGRDVVGIANTGTGKTAAFLIPLLNKLIANREERILIVAPTRELAGQIKQEAMAFAINFHLSAALCIGGVNMSRQVEALRRRPDLVIGTPGRLKDLNQQGVLNFRHFTSIVLDEVDRMLDMGFVRDVRMIIDQLPQERQSLFFSATLSDDVKGVMNSFLRDPIVISVKSQETALNVDQDVIRLAGRPKVEVLHELLSQPEMIKVIIFGRTKRGVEGLSRQLYQRGFNVTALHGNKNQNQRQRALQEFKNSRVTILLATDVAARGLDIADVTHVINYDLPETYEDYVHRIGRTGRANKTGIALSLVD